MPLTKSNPAQIWRDELTYNKVPSAGMPPGVYSDEIWLRHAESEFSASREYLARPISEQEAYTVKKHRGTIYLTGIYLLTCGRLEVVPDILRNRPDRESRGLYSLLNRFTQLIPLPADLRSLSNVEETIAWLQSHRHELIWNEEEGKFSHTPGCAQP